MKANYTHVDILLDRSGSTEKIKDDIIGGFNQFISDQKKQPGVMTLTLAQFDDEYEILYDAVSIQDVKPLTNETFQPRSSTALLDSAAKLIIDTGKKLASLPEEERPERVMFVILTDGKENASIEQTKKSLAKMIKRQEDEYKWQFIYIGANQDGFSEGDSMGMKGFSFKATGKGMKGAYMAMSANLSANRQASRGTNVDLTQDQIDKEEEKA